MRIDHHHLVAGYEAIVQTLYGLAEDPGMACPEWLDMAGFDGNGLGNDGGIHFISWSSDQSLPNRSARVESPSPFARLVRAG